MFDKSDNIHLWFIILIISHIIQDKYSIFKIRSSIETVAAPPFYQQIAGTVILCDVSISVTSSLSDVRDLDLSCKTLYDESLPPATPEQLGELSESLQFFTKIGSEMVKIELDLAFEPENSVVTSNTMEIQEAASETPLVNLVFTATASSSSSSVISSSSSYRLSVRTSSSSSSPSPSSSSSSSRSSFNVHSSFSSSSITTAPPCDGCNCPMEIAMDPDDTDSRTLVLDSPNYPNVYPNNQMCTWTITASYGQLHMVFSKFTVQSDSTCSKDYLQISGPIKKYKRARLCGFPVPTGFNIASKKSKLVLRFRSDQTIRKAGFRAMILATGMN